MRYELSNEKITAAIDTKGAEIVSLKCYGRERLWQNETGEWNAHAPVLFPVCGNCAVRINETNYPIKKHGFASGKEFEVIGQGKNEITFCLNADEETKKAFPFDFRLTVNYRLEESTIVIGYTVDNIGNARMYFSCGGHESFALDGEAGNYEVKFDKKEKIVALEHDENGRLTGESRLLSPNSILPLKQEYFTEGNTLIFGGIKSRGVTLYRKDGRAVARTEFEGFENLLLWKPEHARMICLEPWLNLPDTVAEQKEFSEKAGVIRLEAGERKTLTRKIIYYE